MWCCSASRRCCSICWRISRCRNTLRAWVSIRAG
jgi:hypothetical protein